MEQLRAVVSAAAQRPALHDSVRASCPPPPLPKLTLHARYASSSLVSTPFCNRLRPPLIVSRTARLAARISFNLLRVLTAVPVGRSVTTT